MQNFFDLDTPALLVDLDRLERNIEAMARLMRESEKALWPHTKTHKTPEIARMQVQAGAGGLTVAKLGEAEALADAGLNDFFVANQLVGMAKMERLLALMERVRVRVGVDSAEVALPMGEVAQRAGRRIPVCIEIDTGLGRAGTRSVEEALRLAEIVAGHLGLEFAGIFTHEGHLYRAKEGAERQAAAEAVNGQMRNLAEALEGQGTPAGVVSVGSTPGANLLAALDAPTELRPGVYVFNDRMQMDMGVAPERCALTVLATVTSVRSDGKIIVDAGTKSLASDSPFADKTYGEVVGHPELRMVGASEEHGHLLAEGVTRLRVGEKVRIVPNHACTCVNQHDVMVAVRGENVEATWAIAGRGKIR